MKPLLDISQASRIFLSHWLKLKTVEILWVKTEVNQGARFVPTAMQSGFFSLTENWTAILRIIVLDIVGPIDNRPSND